MLLIATDVVTYSMCLYVFATRVSAAKVAEPIEKPFGRADSRGSKPPTSKEPYFGRGAYRRHLANATDLSVRGCVRRCCFMSAYFDHLLFLLTTALAAV